MSFTICLRVIAVSLLLTLAACQGAEQSAQILDTHIQAEPEPEESHDIFAADEIDFPVADPVLGMIDSRRSQSLNGEWSIIIDPMGVGDPGGLFGGFTENRQQSSPLDLIEYNYETAQTISVPGAFNTQDERLFFYQGRVWYFRKFNAEKRPGMRQHLWFGGANYTTTVFLNGENTGQHIGGYVPFSFDVTDALKDGENTLIIRVDNRLDAESVPTARTDWWPYGGLTRDVALVETPESFIRNVKITLTDRETKTITVEVHTTNATQGDIVEVSLPELNLRTQITVMEKGLARAQFTAPVELWSPNSPRLYRVDLRFGNDTISENIGFRTIETHGQHILLNGERIYLRGISMHEEPIGTDGPAFSVDHMRGLFTEAKALNANFVRSAHYPYSRHSARLADEMGLLLWEEVPVYWNIDWENAATLALARDQIARLVQRDWNRASVIIWSVANETPYSAARMTFLETMINDVRTMDGSRLVSAALMGKEEEFQDVVAHLAVRGIAAPNVSLRDKAIFQAVLAMSGDTPPSIDDTLTLTITDPLGELVDIVGYNEYFGWYYSAFFAQRMGVGEDVLRPLMLDLMPHIRLTAAFDKPLHISEMGAGAQAGNHSDTLAIWSEEYQALVYERQIAMLRNSPQVQGVTPWILKDFRAMLRPLAGVQDYRNRKGLVDENGERKLAFDVLADFYAEEW